MTREILIEIFASDLKEEVLEKILRRLGVKSIEELNWDIVPLAAICITQEE